MRTVACCGVVWLLGVQTVWADEPEPGATAGDPEPPAAEVEAENDGTGEPVTESDEMRSADPGASTLPESSAPIEIPPDRPRSKAYQDWSRSSAAERQEVEPNSGERVAVNLTAQVPGTVYYLRADSGFSSSQPSTTIVDGQLYERLCEAPCSHAFPVGKNRLALGIGSGTPIPIAQEFTFYERTTLHGEYRSYATRRLFGGLLVAAGSIGAIVAVLTAPECREREDLEQPLDCSATQEIVGISAGAALGITGAWLLFKSDSAEIRVGLGATEKAALAGLPKLQLSGRF